MAMWLVWVGGNAPTRDVVARRVVLPKGRGLTIEERNTMVAGVIGRVQPHVWLEFDHIEELEDKLIESGFESKFDFINYYSRAE
jgi:hypothetical protein